MKRYIIIATIIHTEDIFKTLENVLKRLFSYNKLVHGEKNTKSNGTLEVQTNNSKSKRTVFHM